MMVYGQENAAPFLQEWLEGKSRIVLVTGRRSYAACGAQDWLEPFLSSKALVHLTTAGENARKEDVDALRAGITSQPDGYIAVGGGTAIDTTKLLREFSGVPFLAVPTTAGTGAEATRFAVYYDRGRKCSADDVRYLPTDQLLIPEFCDSASSYQRAACGFDAYAQAVESLWAKGATDESRRFARQALDLMAKGQQLLGAYWAGRAIDISRTTAAHAFSYYLTSQYGIPHGHAVYMMFPFICHNNGHPEYIKAVPELQTLRQFAAARGLVWAELVDALFANVNLKRLGNNPVEVRKDSFKEELG